MKLRSIIEYPYKKYLYWKHKKDISTRYRLVNLKYSINVWNLLIFYLILLGIITISLAVFIGVFLIISDIVS